MSKAKNLFYGLEIEGFTRILEKQKNQESSRKLGSEETRVVHPQEPVKLSEYIRKNSQKKDKDSSRDSIKKFIEGVGGNHSSLSPNDMHLRKKVNELKEFVRKNINNQENYHLFERMLGSFELGIHPPERNTSEEADLTENLSSFQYEPQSPVLRQKFEEFNGGKQLLSPVVPRKRMAHFQGQTIKPSQYAVMNK